MTGFRGRSTQEKGDWNFYAPITADALKLHAHTPPSAASGTGGAQPNFYSRPNRTRTELTPPHTGQYPFRRIHFTEA